jgi:hypothetical protein
MLKTNYSRILLIMAVMSFGVVSATDLQAQQNERKAKQTASEKKKKKRKAPPRQAQAPGGYPSCHVGVLWVDTLCQMRDGRICSVDEYDLVNCN